MPTGDTRVELALKRFLSQNRLSSNFMDYLRAEYLDLGARIFPVSGLFTYPVTITPNWATAKFTLTPPVGTTIEGIDNAGHVLQLEDAAHHTSIKFDNTVGIHNWIGLRYIEIVSGVYANPRSGVPEYDLNMNEVGEKDVPDSVTDNGDGTITFVVNSVTQSGYSHASRSVKAWLKNPVSIDVTVAIETRPVTYLAPNNSIRTLGSFGQSAISVDPNDYYVACIGPTVHVQPLAAPMPFGDEYIVIGYIVGGAPGSTSTVDQVDLSGGGGHTLQKAYDGLSGSGSGNTVSVQDQAIVLRQENTTYRDVDIMNSALRIRKDIPTTLHDAGFLDEGGIDITTRFEAAHSFVGRVSIHDMTGSDELRVEEDINITDVNKITFTRAGVDLNLGSSTYSAIRTTVDLVEISGSVLGQNGVYAISVVDAGGAILTCYEYNSTGVSPAWVNEAGLKARIYRPVVRINTSSYALKIRPVSDFYRDFNAGSAMPLGQIGIIMPVNTNDDEPVIKIDRDTENFEIRANADLHTDGHIYSNVSTGMLIFTAGLLHADAIDMNGRSINCDSGYLGNVGLLDMDAPGDGGQGIDMNGTDIIDADDITSSTGDFEATIGDYIYGGAGKTHTIIIGAEDAIAEDRSTTAFPATFSFGSLSDEGGGQYSMWHGEGAGAGDYSYVVFPFFIPVGAVITQAVVMFGQAAASRVRAELLRDGHNWAGPAPTARTSIAGPTLSGAVVGDTTITLTPAGGHTVLVNNKYMVAVRLEAHVGEACYVYQVKVTYTMNIVRPPV